MIDVAETRQSRELQNVFAGKNHTTILSET
jgi:hypothetical protein